MKRVQPHFDYENESQAPTWDEDTPDSAEPAPVEVVRALERPLGVEREEAPQLAVVPLMAFGYPRD